MNQKLRTICDQLSEITQWPGRNTAFPATDPSCRGGKAFYHLPRYRGILFWFSGDGEGRKKSQRSRPVEVIYSLIRRNQGAEFNRDLLKTKAALGWVSSFWAFTSSPEQQRKVCSWEQAPFQPPLPCFRSEPTATLLPAAGQGWEACSMY